MPRRPRSLLFSVNERPAPASIALLAFQHAALSAVFLVYAAIIAKGAGFTMAQQQAMLMGTLLSCGIGAIFQGAVPKLSSGLLVIPLSSPMFVIFGIPAGQEAGPGGIATLAVVGGLVQILVGQVLKHVRKFFPPEVCGVVVLMLGISMVPHALERIAGMQGTDISTVSTPSIMTGLATLGSIIACSIWLTGSKRYFAMLIGCVIGYGFSGYLGLLGQFASIEAQASLVSLPTLVMPNFALDPSFILTYVVVAMIASIDNMGVLISTDRLDDADWSKPDVPKTSRGVSSLGATTILSGLLGGTQLGFSSTNIGLAFATGVTSRIVGVYAGMIMVAVSFLPKILALDAAMPEPVLGGILAYAASYFIVAGAQLALSRMLSPRRLIVIGLPVSCGVGLQSLPAPVLGGHGIAEIFLHSPLMVASVMVIVLNALTQIGIAQKASINVAAGTGRLRQVEMAIEGWGELWGLKPATAMQASQVTNQLLETVLDLADGAVSLEARHDDVNLDISVVYAGQPMMFPTRAPTPEELLEDPDGMARMSGWLVRHLANRATIFTRGGKQGVMLRFET